jgi:iron complex transport system ATP-binding protein
MTETFEHKDHPVLQVDGVGVRTDGATLLEDVSFEAPAGHLLALVGPNGAGKSTMLSVLAGDLVPSTGQAMLNGADVRHERPQDLAVVRAVMTQQQSLAFSFTVRELVRMGRAPHPASEDDDEIVRESMRSAEIEEFADRDVTTLSGGELARGVFARVLAQRTPVLLLDEPTAPLDLRHQEKVMATAESLARDGACVLVVLHDLSLAARYCDHIAMFSDGHLVAIGEPDDVLTAERISEVYGQEVLLLRHPCSGRPLVVPR